MGKRERILEVIFQGAFLVIFGLILIDIISIKLTYPANNVIFSINTEKHGVFIEKIWTEVKKEMALEEAPLPSIFIEDNDLYYAALGIYSPSTKTIHIYYNVHQIENIYFNYSKKESEINFFITIGLN